MSGPWAKYGGGQPAAPQGPWAKYKPTGPMSFSQAVTGAMANLNRGLGVGDEMAAGIDTARKVVTGEAGLSDVPDAFKASMAHQRAIEDQYAREHPHLAALARGTGMAATAAVPAGQVAQGGRVMNAARGAVSAAVGAAGYGLADRGSVADRVSAAKSSATNPLVLALGAGAGAIAPTVAAARDPARTTPAQVLAAEGVPLTPGQRIGGIVKNAEDLAQRAPILGQAIRGARQRSVQGLNAAVANRALAPIGQRLPGNVAPGHDAVGYVSDALGQAYDDAAAMVPQVQVDDQFGQALEAIGQRARELPPGIGEQFQNIVQNRLNSRLGNGPLTGPQMRQVQSELGYLASQQAGSGDAAQRALGDMLDDTAGEVGGLIGRNNPEAGDLINRANEGWANFTRLRNAASRAKGGVATPGQLAQAVRMGDRSVGKGAVARGDALMQDLTDAASQVMPDAYGNPGTADAAGWGALGMGLATAPAHTVPAAAGLTAASVPYLLMGRRPVVPPGEINLSAGAIDQRGQELARLARAVGLYGGATVAQGASTQ